LPGDGRDGVGIVGKVRREQDRLIERLCICDAP
jgi:hypothetical protein